ncbi:uncharacterized protein LOC110031897 [Phalaenopsis equestris]|uniref:uncharacterized protein LOC110031897 n=1 Tax=Phalaenopsis equestris TaxID=78828 RepID=UPI0009E239F4|nr:uncharacterized protein LOC110031897 [Phalaenopsis equestris]XP_020590981.1 uncharacterized protein LOC110031897 [Phalaenopsis equestris]
MFTEGLDAQALRWVKEEHAEISNVQQRTHASQDFKTSTFRLDIPPPEKFKSGHLPTGSIPISYAVPLEEDSDFDSDMDESSDTEEIYAGRHSTESSSSLPHEDISKQRVPNGVSSGHCRYANSVVQQHCSSSDGYSGYSSSRDTAQQRTVQARKLVDMNRYAEEEEMWSDSGESFGFNGQVERKNASIEFSLQGASREDGNSDAAKSASLGGNCAFQGSHSSGNCKDGDSNSEKGKHLNIPSAPPFDGYGKETDHAAVEVPSINTCLPPISSSWDGSFIKEEILNAHYENQITDKQSRSSSSGLQQAVKSGSLRTRLPKFHASGQGPWHCVLAYDACVRLCLHSWARGCMQAPSFLENECALLRKAFGLQQILLQSETELLGQQSSGSSSEGIMPKPKKIIGKIKIQVHKVRMSPEMPSGCSISAMNLSTANIRSLQSSISSLHTLLAAEWKSLRNLRFLLCLPSNSSLAAQSLACVNASTLYAKKGSALFKVGVTSMQTPSYTCRLKLKSRIKEEAVQLDPGSGEAHAFFPDSIGDDLYVEVYDSKGKSCGRAVVQVASISDVNEKTRWLPIYVEPEHLLVGRMQVYLSYKSSPDENNEKCGSIAETVAYDVVMEVAMKAQHVQQRNLTLHGSWQWLLTEFATYFGVSYAYTKLRYLSYVMDVATPTKDCLMLVHDLLLPVIMKSNMNTLSHQENRILGEMKEQIDQVLSLVFENYKSLDESSFSGLVEVFGPPNGNPAPALAISVKLYTLIHDILSPEAQLMLCNYFQVGVKKRSRRHMLDTDEIFANSTEGTLLDVVGIATTYQKMKSLCYDIVKEIRTDFEIYNHHILPSFIDLPSLSASIYSVELCTRLRSFLKACPPTGLSQHVADLVIATADFQKDLASWSISPVKGGVDAKELFHLYIILWIQDKRLTLLESCKLDKVKWSGVRTQHLTTPFVDEIYDRLKETLNEYEIIMRRWPEYILVLENAIVDVEKAMLETLQKQYADVLSPLKDSMAPKSLGLKFVHKLARGKKVCPYSIPDELGILLNTMKRLLDVLRPRIEMELKSWGSCMPDTGNAVAGERLSEVAVIVRSKFRNYLHAVVEKLAENTRAQRATNLKKILQESKSIVAESDVRKRMQPLKDHLTDTINHIDKVLEVKVFVSVCRCLWERLGQDVLKFLENHKENKSLCKASRATVAVLDETFASQMQKLLGNNTLQEKDLEPPRSILEVRSILCKDVYRDSSFNYRVRA